MTTKNSGIYKITNIVNNKIYIGSAYNISNRFSVHVYTLNNNKHKNKHLQFAWNKYGKINFKFEIIELVHKEQLLLREQYWIDLYKPYQKNIGYNMAKKAGNTAGIKASEQTRRKQSEAAKKRPKRILSEQERLKISERYKGQIAPWSKLNWIIINEIRTLYANGITQKNISKKYNIAQTTVSEIIRNLIWKNEKYTYGKRKNKD
jgi:group I intron endonuclease